MIGNPEKNKLHEESSKNRHLSIQTTDFFVAGNATYNSPCRSVRPSVRPSVRHTLLFLHFWALLPLPKAILPLPKAILPLPKAILPLPKAILPLPKATLPLPKAILPLPNRPRQRLSCIRPCYLIFLFHTLPVDKSTPSS